MLKSNSKDVQFSMSNEQFNAINNLESYFDTNVRTFVRIQGRLADCD